MTRELTDHKVNPGNDRLLVQALDGPGPGGASHQYRIEYTESTGAPASVYCELHFQNGPINADGNGINGITHEALLAILCDRLRAFQASPYACRENALALTKLEEAQMWLLQRTRNRMARGVEGTHKV